MSRLVWGNAALLAGAIGVPAFFVAFVVAAFQLRMVLSAFGDRLPRLTIFVTSDPILWWILLPTLYVAQLVLSVMAVRSRVFRKPALALVFLNTAIGIVMIVGLYLPALQA